MIVGMYLEQFQYGSPYMDPFWRIEERSNVGHRLGWDTEGVTRLNNATNRLNADSFWDCGSIFNHNG